MMRDLIHTKLQPALGQTKSCLGIQVGDLDHCRLQRLQQQSAIWQNGADLSSPCKVPPPGPQRSSPFCNRSGLVQTCQLGQQNRLLTCTARLKPHQKPIQECRGCQFTIRDQGLLLVHRDGLEEKVHTSLFRPVVPNIIQLIRKARHDLDPLEWRCGLPSIIVALRLPQRQIPPPR